MNKGKRAVVIPCSAKYLPRSLWLASVEKAREVNPDNVPEDMPLPPAPPKEGGRLALDIKRYWGKGGVKLSVSFLDNPPKDLRKRILSHMNAWSRYANVKFSETASTGQVRIARVPDDGYWSYVGTDVLLINPGKPTMNLDSFTMSVPDSEYHRVVRHETGHTLGFPHEHMRQAIIARLDEKKTIAYFKRTQGWSESEIRDQVLTPLEENQLLGTSPDDRSIMCYDIPGECTRDGLPVIGGVDIDASDKALVRQVYPKPPRKPKTTARPKSTGTAKARPKAKAKTPATGRKVAAKKAGRKKPAAR